MQNSSPKEKILTNIRNALINKNEAVKDRFATSGEIYHRSAKDLSIIFGEEIQKTGGNFVYCETLVDFANGLKGLVDSKGWEAVFCQDKSLQKLLKEARIPYRYSNNQMSEAMASLSRCEYLIARYGSVVVSSKTGTGRQAHVLPEAHLILAFTTQITMDIREAMTALKQRYRNQLPSMISFITGPSRTADIEKTLVMGAHGPRELYVFLIEA